MLSRSSCPMGRRTFATSAASRRAATSAALATDLGGIALGRAPALPPASRRCGELGPLRLVVLVTRPVITSLNSRIPVPSCFRAPAAAWARRSAARSPERRSDRLLGCGTFGGPPDRDSKVSGRSRPQGVKTGRLEAHSPEQSSLKLPSRAGRLRASEDTNEPRTQNSTRPTHRPPQRAEHRGRPFQRRDRRRPRAGLHMCPDCDSDLVQPIDWSEAPERVLEPGARAARTAEWYDRGHVHPGPGRRARGAPRRGPRRHAP